MFSYLYYCLFRRLEFTFLALERFQFHHNFGNNAFNVIYGVSRKVADNGYCIKALWSVLYNCFIQILECGGAVGVSCRIYQSWFDIFCPGCANYKLL